MKPAAKRKPRWLWICLLLLVMGPSTITNNPKYRSVVVVTAEIPHTITIDKHNQDDLDKKHFDETPSRLGGLIALFSLYPDFILSVSIRILICMALELMLDGFLKTVVTPAIIATGIGAVVAPLIFLLEYALQPIIHSIAFIIFDDKFLMATLEATGIKDQLEAEAAMPWHSVTFTEGFITRYVIKSMATSCLGWAGLCTIVPVAGHILTAVLTGWVVAWDYVYVPLAGMGYIGPWQQAQTVWEHFGDYQWYGFWAVMAEEIPFLGPTCHVYNVYSAAFFLERVYLLHNKDDDATVATTASEDSSFYDL